MKKRVAILGAGPIGIETALRAIEDGYEVEVFDQNGPGAHVATWQHVRFFSPWALNRSVRGEKVSRELGMELGGADVYPTGRQYLDEYLLPLASSRLLGPRIRKGATVLGISRRQVHKGEWIGRPERGASPFIIQILEQGGETFVEADIVIDATGVLQSPNRLGPGGLHASGERQASSVIASGIPDVLGEDRETYAGKRVLVVGEGYSAATSLKLLAELRRAAPQTQLSWVMRSFETPYEVIPNDSLPERAALVQFANDAARGQIEGLTPLVGSIIVAIDPGDEGVRVQIESKGQARVLTVDRIISNVGYRPDTTLFQELQVHLCYASEGPMKLAASLLAAGGGGGDCLAQTSGGVDVLRNPEPNFFILGAKSYGRNSDFLLKLGFAQIDEVFDALR